MITVLSESTPIARKDHRCIACEWVFDAGHNIEDFSMREKRLLVKARKNKYKIVKGQKYIRQGNIQDGELYTFKAIPEIHQICLDHDIYCE